MVQLLFGAIDFLDILKKLFDCASTAGCVVIQLPILRLPFYIGGNWPWIVTQIIDRGREGLETDVAPIIIRVSVT